MAVKYLCYDTALNEEYTLLQLMQQYPRHFSLFHGTDDEQIWDAAPYFFEVADNFYDLKAESSLIRLDHCIVFETDEPQEEILRFLQRRFYKSNDNGPVYFRIWDARVLIHSFQKWSVEERMLFFEFFNCFYTENANPLYFDKWQTDKGHNLIAEKILKSAVLPNRKGFPVTGNAGFEEPATGGIKEARAESASSLSAEAPANGPAKRRIFFN